MILLPKTRNERRLFKTKFYTSNIPVSSTRNKYSREKINALSYSMDSSGLLFVFETQLPHRQFSFIIHSVTISIEFHVSQRTHRDTVW